jgi:hypothetical protein
MKNIQKQVERIKEHLLPISTNEDWSTAKNEWRLHSQYEYKQIDNSDVISNARKNGYTVNHTGTAHCLCGQNILYCSVVYNETTNQMAVIGNDCANNAIGIATDTYKLKQLKEDRRYRLELERIKNKPVRIKSIRNEVDEVKAIVKENKHPTVIESTKQSEKYHSSEYMLGRNPELSKW